MEFDIVNDILIELGWDKGISIPVANDENKLFCDLIRNTKKNVILNKHEILSLQEKLTVIAEHKKNARIERSNCEGIVDALNHDIETENHLTKISERELGRIKQDIEIHRKQLIEIAKRKNIYENTNYSKSMELEEIKEKMQWNQQDLEKYLAECNNQEDLADYLNQYTRQDNSKAAVLNHQITELIDVQNKARKHLDEAVIETKILQVELDKSADQYRKEHQARKDVIKMWQTTIEQMSKRDNDILRISNELNEYKAKLRQTELEMQEKKALCQDINNDNNKIEKCVNRADKEIAILRETLGDLIKELDKLKREHGFIQSTIERTARECEIARSAIRHMKDQEEFYLNKIKILQTKTDELQRKYDFLMSECFDNQRLLAMTETNLKEEDLYIRQLNEELNRLREKQYKITLDLAAHQAIKRNKEADGTTYRANLRNLISRKGKYESDLMKLDELIYKTDLNIQNLQHRISTIEGDNTSSELENELKMRIILLQEELDSINRVSKQLTEMINRFANEARIHRMNIEKLTAVKKIEIERINAEQITIDNAKIQLKKVKVNREETLVYKNMENFQLKKLRTLCDLNFNKVTDLAIQKESLNAIINDRRIEINFFKDILKKEIRRLEIDLANIHKEWSHVKHRLDKTMNKYEVVSKVSYFENKDGVLATIEAAVKKEELQKYGDELDLKIRKSEKEIRALENTVVLLNTCNESFRYLYTKATPSSTELVVKEQVENNLKSEMKLYSLKRYQMRLLLKETEKANETLENLEMEYANLENRISETQGMIDKKYKDINKMNEKIERADSDRNSALSNISDPTHLVDIKVRVAIHMNGLLVSEIIHILTKKFPDIWTEIGQTLFQSFNIEFNQHLKNTQNNAITQRSSVNSNNNRNSSKTLQISVINLASNFNSEIPSTASSARSNSNSNLSSNQSSVKLQLKNQGIKPFSPNL